MRQNQRVIQRHAKWARDLEARLASALEAEIELLKAEAEAEAEAARCKAGADAAAATREAERVEAAAAAERGAERLRADLLEADAATKTLAEAQALASRRRIHRRMTAPLRDAPHRLAIVVPFRDDGGADALSQGIGRSRNLDEFGKMTKASHDYMVLQDVDQVPERRENAYAWRDEPTLLLGATSQWQYKVSSNESHVVGGAFQISHAEYSDVGGYSNLFEGWGMEDHNMGWRVRKHMGYGKLDGNIGRYTALAHERVKGLDRTEAFGRNAENAERDLSRGVDEVRFTALAESATPCGDECAGIATEALCASARANATALDSIFAAVAAHDRTDAKPGDVAAARDALAAVRADAGARRRCAWQEERCVSKASVRRALVRLDPTRSPPEPADPPGATVGTRGGHSGVSAGKREPPTY
ncbi:N-acetyllactosamine synthase [Aureococcus anophagefferens]|nr:N-acetyllactosamine synthase [Aureococcus anophagefferens]